MMDDAASSDTVSTTSPPNAPDPAGEPTLPPAEGQPGPADALGPTVELEDGATWSPQKIVPETGVALEGDYPANHRLRAEALSDAGLDADPDGIVSDELIADAGKRIAGERKYAEEVAAQRDKAFPPVHANMKTAELEKIGSGHGLDLSTAANNDERVRMIEDARAAGIATPLNEGSR
jgi:hypothetical protein